MPIGRRRSRAAIAEPPLVCEVHGKLHPVDEKGAIVAPMKPEAPVAFEWPTLDKYFEENVVGGQGNFVIPADDYSAYAEGIYKKLLREITGPGIS